MPIVTASARSTSAGGRLDSEKAALLTAPRACPVATNTGWLQPAEVVRSGTSNAGGGPARRSPWDACVGGVVSRMAWTVLPAGTLCSTAFRKRMNSRCRGAACSGRRPCPQPRRRRRTGWSMKASSRSRLTLPSTAARAPRRPRRLTAPAPLSRTTEMLRTAWAPRRPFPRLYMPPPAQP